MRQSCLLLGLALLALGGCRPTGRRRDELRAVLGVSAGELGAAATPERLQAVAKDQAAADPTQRRLGLAECLRLADHARTLAREAAAISPLLGAPEDRLAKVTAELSGAVSCDAPLDPEALGARLRKALKALRALRGG